jgi:amino acid adenylation domain-containing protein
MDNIKDLILILEKKSVKISLDNSKENLRLTGNVKNITSIDKEQILSKKQELIAFLKQELIGGKEISKNDIRFNALNKSNVYSVPKAAQSESYPLTPSQGRLWIISQFENASLAYNMSTAIQVEGDFYLDKFEESFQYLINRHEILRTYFVVDHKGEVRQYILPKDTLDFTISFKDYSDSFDQLQDTESHLELKNNEPFKLEKAPLLRVSVIRLANKKHIISLCMHHIIGDGWSMQILMSEVMQYYKMLIQGKTLEIPELSVQYKDYAVWLTTELKKEKHHAAEEYWLNQFSGNIPVLNLSGFKPRPLVKTYSGNTFSYKFPGTLLEDLKSFSKEKKSTLFMLLIAGINIILHKHSGQDDIIIGTPIAGREHPDLEKQLGLFLNTLAIRTPLNKDSTFNDFFELQKKILLDAYQHQQYPFDELVGKLNLKRDTGRSALFDVMVILQNQNQSFQSTNNSDKELKVEKYENKRNISQFDMTFSFVEQGANGLLLNLNYNSDIYDQEVVERIVTHFEQVLTQIITDQNIILKNIACITENEKLELAKFNATEINYPKDKTVVDLFQEQANKFPDNIAVKDDFTSYTYKELDLKSDRIASHIVDNYGNNHEPVGVCINRSADLIPLLMGIFKSGKPYIPIDPNLPESRIKYIVENSGTKLIVVDKNNYESDEIKWVNSAEIGLEETNKALNIAKIKPQDSAYIIYTSGSTGNPKGVEIDHSSLFNFLLSIKEKLNITAQDLLFSVTTYSFDISILEFFLPLISGAEIYIANQVLLSDPKEVCNKIAAIKPTLIQATPSFYQMLFDAGWQGDKNIKILCGGDSLNDKLAEKIFLNASEFWNMYGPTETTIWSSTKKIEGPLDTLNIGTPIHNTKFYILDDAMNMQAIGIAGNIFIGGAGLAKGYYNNLALTKERFITNPFNNEELIYNTGDLGRWLPDGNIGFLGREDHQVKIRGHRIELGEIELVLSQYSQSIKQVVVDAKEINENKVLVAYFISDNELDKSELRNYLQTKLPEYMLPNYFVNIDVLPLTANGKIDRKALPEITAEDFIKKEYKSPSNSTEEKLVEIWQEVLGVEKIGITDDFFELGGHSLIVMKLKSIIENHFLIKITTVDVFNNPTIQGVALLIKELEFINSKNNNVRKSRTTI